MLIDVAKKRKITKEQEDAYRCRHHDHEGLTEEEAADELGISPRAVRGRLTRMQKIAPQLFPILSRKNALVWALWHAAGLTCAEIAERIKCTESAVTQRLQRIKKKMGYTERIIANPHRAISLDTMDIDTVIVRRF